MGAGFSVFTYAVFQDELDEVVTSVFVVLRWIAVGFR